MQKKPSLVCRHKVLTREIDKSIPMDYMPIKRTFVLDCTASNFAFYRMDVAHNFYNAFSCKQGWLKIEDRIIDDQLKRRRQREAFPNDDE